MISKATCWPLTSGVVVPVVGDLLMTRSHFPGLAWSGCVVLPVPAWVGVRVTDGTALKVAVQLLAALIVTEAPGAVPPQAPLQPANIEPGSGAAVSVTAMPIE